MEWINGPTMIQPSLWACSLQEVFCSVLFQWSPDTDEIIKGEKTYGNKTPGS